MNTKSKQLKYLLIGLLMIPIGNSCTSKKIRTTSPDSYDTNIRSVKANQGEVSILAILQRLPGVTVRGNVVRVFGPNSFSNATEPMFLVNGAYYNGGLSGILSTINPDNVKSVEVYKTPSELALYGARGSNGVINIILRN